MEESSSSSATELIEEVIEVLSEGASSEEQTSYLSDFEANISADISEIEEAWSSESSTSSTESTEESEESETEIELEAAMEQNKVDDDIKLEIIAYNEDLEEKIDAEVEYIEATWTDEEESESTSNSNTDSYSLEESTTQEESDSGVEDLTETETSLEDSYVSDFLENVSEDISELE